MAVPDAYSEAELAQYMHSVLGKTATALEWTVPVSYAEAVTDALLLLGVEAVEDATNIGDLRACARYTVWQAVEADTAGFHQFSSDSQSFHHEQIHAQSVQMVQAARKDLMKLGINYRVTSTPVTHARDPYVFRQEVG